MNVLLQKKMCVLTLIRCPFHPRIIAVARKKTRSVCQKCRWQVTPKNACTLDPTKSEWADYTAVQAYCGNLSENDLTRNSSGNTRLQSSQLAEPLWTDSVLSHESSVLSLISTLGKQNKKHRPGMNFPTFYQNIRKRGKAINTVCARETDLERERIHLKSTRPASFVCLCFCLFVCLFYDALRGTSGSARPAKANRAKPAELSKDCNT